MCSTSWVRNVSYSHRRSERISLAAPTAFRDRRTKRGTDVSSAIGGSAAARETGGQVGSNDRGGRIEASRVSRWRGGRGAARTSVVGDEDLPDETRASAREDIVLELYLGAGHCGGKGRGGQDHRTEDAGPRARSPKRWALTRMDPVVGAAGSVAPKGRDQARRGTRDASSTVSESVSSASPRCLFRRSPRPGQWTVASGNANTTLYLPVTRVGDDRRLRAAPPDEWPAGL